MSTTELQTMNPILLGVLIVLGLILVLMVYGIVSIGQKPKNNPEAFLKSNPDDRPVVLFAGDSITHGNVQPNWTLLVEEKLGETYQYVNGGINGNTTTDVLARMDEMLECKPSVVTLMIGNNNAMGSLERNQSRYNSSGQEDWSAEAFDSELRELLTKFKDSGASVAVFSLIPYSEWVDSDEFGVTRDYSEIIKKAAIDLSVDYLPIFETIEDLLKKEGTDPQAPPADKDMMMMLTGMTVRRRVLMQSWDTIGRKRHLKFTVDNIHINSRTAGMMAEMVVKHIKNH